MIGCPLNLHGMKEIWNSDTQQDSLLGDIRKEQPHPPHISMLLFLVPRRALETEITGENPNKLFCCFRRRCSSFCNLFKEISGKRGQNVETRCSVLQINQRAITIGYGELGRMIKPIFIKRESPEISVTLGPEQKSPHVRHWLVLPNSSLRALLFLVMCLRRSGLLLASLVITLHALGRERNLFSCDHAGQQSNAQWILGTTNLKNWIVAPETFCSYSLLT